MFLQDQNDHPQPKQTDHSIPPPLPNEQDPPAPSLVLTLLTVFWFHSGSDPVIVLWSLPTLVLIRLILLLVSVSVSVRESLHLILICSASTKRAEWMY